MKSTIMATYYQIGTPNVTIKAKTQILRTNQLFKKDFEWEEYWKSLTPKIS